MNSFLSMRLYQNKTVKYKKPELKDGPIDKQTKPALEKLLEANKDTFSENKRPIGTRP